MKLDRREVFSTMAYLGMALVVAGLVRYSVQEIVTTPTKWILIAGGALLVAGGAGSAPKTAGGLWPKTINTFPSGLNLVTMLVPSSTVQMLSSLSTRTE